MAGEWTTSELADLTINFDGKRKPVKESDRRPGPYPYYGASGVVDHVDGFLFDGDYLLIAEDGENLRTRQTPIAFMAKGKFWVNNHAHIVTGNDKADTRFLMYALQNADISGYLTGAVMPKLTQGNLNRIEISHPCVIEQRAIAHILGTLDDKIELNRRRNQTLEAMARALFKDWFVDFGPVRARMEGREPYLPAALWQLFPERLDDEGKPEGWEMVPASEFIEFNPTEPLRKGTPAPYLDMASLPTSGSWPEPPVMRDFGSGMRFRNGDTLLARITPCLENGKTAFVHCLPDDTVGWGSTEYIVMRPKAPVPGGYAYLLARDDAFREHAIRSMTGTSGRQRAQGDSVATFKLASPSDEDLWHAFERLVSPTFESIKSNAKASETLSALRDTLLPKLISGELRIAEAERFLARAEALDRMEVTAT